MHYTYFLYSEKHHRVYVGITDNLKERLERHNHGDVTSTKPYQPWILAYYEAHRSRTLARKAELFYKTSQGRRQVQKKLGLK